MDQNTKVAFITGANRGIGLETAKQLAATGAEVVIGCRDKAKGEEVAAQIRAQGHKARAIKFDVTAEADHKTAASFFETNFGRLDILINNAGIMRDPEGSNATNVTMGVMKETFESNFFCTVALTQALLPMLRLSDAGRIVNLSSILGSQNLHATPGSPIYDSKRFAYNSSKTALNAFTIHLAYELKGTKVKVNSAHPGWVKTDMGGEEAPLNVSQGAKTSVQLALLPDHGPTGGFFHMGETLPW